MSSMNVRTTGLRRSSTKPCISLVRRTNHHVELFSRMIADLRRKKGSQPRDSPDICSRLGVETRVSQAIQLMDNVELSLSRSGKFMYRAPTFYENDVNNNRSPLVQSSTNALFALTSRTGDTSDPFGNIPRKLKLLVNKLCLDEGIISEKIWRRQRKVQFAASMQKVKQEAEERQNRLGVLSKLTLQKTTQTDPTFCTDCLIRKIKTKTNSETQTAAPLTVNSFVQTKPIQVERVTEFGAITELTPNQVKAVSELIKYIKLTATSGTLEEMRNTMREDHVESLNSDLRTAYQYFDAMVGNKSHDVEESSQLFSRKAHQHVDSKIQHQNVRNHPQKFNNQNQPTNQTAYQYIDAKGSSNIINEGGGGQPFGQKVVQFQDAPVSNRSQGHMVQTMDDGGAPFDPNTYQYYDSRFQTATQNNPPAQVIDEDQPFDDPGDYGEEDFNEDVEDFKEDVVDFKADENSVDEYEEFHKNFCGDEEDINAYVEDENEDTFVEDENTSMDPFGSNANSFGRNQQRSVGFETNPLNAGTSGGSHQFGSAIGNYSESNRGHYNQQRGGRGRGKHNPRGFRSNAYNRRN